jgi:type I restriction enzyme S subunit
MTSKEPRLTRTGGRPATEGMIPGRYALSVGKPSSAAPDGWVWTRLTDVARLETGHTPARKKAEYWGGDVPWIGIRDATSNHGRVLMETEQYTNELGIANSSARVLPALTVCLSRTASVGYVVVMGRPMATSQDFVNWVCSDKLDWRFLKYVLVAERDSYRRFAHGTTHQTIYFPEVKAFHVCLPPRAEQCRIAGVLSALDDKIEHNRVLSTRLAEVLSLDFRERFAPVLAVSVSDSDGWEFGSLGDEIEVIMGQSPPGSSYSEDQEAGPPLIQGNADLGSRFPVPSRYTSAPTKRARSDDVLFTVRAPVGEINIADREYCLGRGVAALRSNLAVYAEQLVRALAGRWAAEESGTIFPSVNRSQIAGLEINRPPRQLAERFDRQHRPTFELIGVLDSETRALAGMRDALLPRLVSGQIRVPDSYEADDVLGTVAEEAGAAV